MLPDLPSRAESRPRPRRERANAPTAPEALRDALSDVAAASQDRAFRVARRIDYFRRVGQIFADMKIADARLSKLPDQKARDAAWDIVHERNADRVLDLAVTLRGFYVKAGQLLSTRADFVPQQWTKKLAVLQDDTPPLPPDEALELVEKELAAACDTEFRLSRKNPRAGHRIPTVCRVYGEGAGRIPVDAVFEPGSIDWECPVGSASLASVYTGTLRETGKKVAIKVQNPAAARLVMGDVDSLVTVGKLLEKTDLRINFTPFLTEIRRQVSKELDFSNEARTMDSVGFHLEGINRVRVPRSIPGLVTPRLLVMDFLEGRNLNALAKQSQLAELPQWKKRGLGVEILNLTSAAWGRMIFRNGLFHGDCHPGNLLIRAKQRRWFGRKLPPSIELGIIDFGQAKQLERPAQIALARLVMALSDDEPSTSAIATALRATGLQFERMGREENEFLARAARFVFSTENVDGKSFQPFGKDSILAENAVTDIPSTLVFVIRVIQIQRGIASGLGIDDFSVAKQWRNEASELLKSQRALPY